ncbi:MAG: hypothetical protein KIT79_07095 [Deltaproteobacteria bacterium]|nr:hypothetical protein [Deltaproteobacteria bacterium]
MGNGRNPLPARDRIDHAPSSHPREMPGKTARELRAEREEVIWLDAKIQSELGPEDYLLCRLRATGHSWQQIAAAAEVRFGGQWSPQRAAARTGRARDRLSRYLEKLAELDGAGES